MRSIIIMAVVTALLLLPAPAKACSCMDPGPPCQAYGAAAAVFSGQVIEITRFSSGAQPSYGQRLVRFAISEAFRGVSGGSAETITGAGGGDCGYPFKVGESYLVYAYRPPNDDRLYAGICSRTRPMSEASEDLEYIRNFSKSESGGQIYGSVNSFRRVNAENSHQQIGPMEGVRITIEGGGKRIEAVTDGKGKYRAAGLRPGNYLVRITAPNGLWPKEDERKAEIKENGCAVVDFAFQPNTSLSGQVFDEGSGPASKILVDLIPLDEINNRYQKYSLFVRADEEGRFIFRTLPPGNYFLGVRLNRITPPTFPYPRTFYPGTQELTQALAITISEGQTLEGYNIRLPAKLRPRKIDGAVVWPDGTPVPDSSICVEEVEYAGGSLCFGNDAKVGEDGRFSFTLLEGIRYLVRAHVNVRGGSGQRHAEPVEVPANGDVSDIKLVITEPNGNCEKCRMWRRK
jgi:protocatechuate 3,4-dioxygenase beta subunit